MKRWKGFTAKDLAEVKKGMQGKRLSVRTVKKEIAEAVFDPSNLESIVGWLNSPISRKNKGQALPWLNGKRGRNGKLSEPE